MRRAGRGRAEVVEDEVAVGDRVDRVRARRARSRARAATMPRSVSKFVPASAPAPSGSAAVCAATKREALAVAHEHPEVGEQVVRQVDRLGALQVRVAGQRPVEVALGGVDERRAQRRRAPRVAAAPPSRVNSATSVATWSLRERAVCSLPPTGAGDLGQPPLDRHVDVLVVVGEREASRPPARPRRRRARPAARRGRPRR